MCDLYFSRFRSKQKKGNGEYESRWAYLSRYLVRISKHYMTRVPLCHHGICRSSLGGVVVVGIAGLILVGMAPLVVSVPSTRNKK